MASITLHYDSPLGNPTALSRCCTKGDTPSLPCVDHEDDPLLTTVVSIDDVEIATREANQKTPARMRHGRHKRCSHQIFHVSILCAIYVHTPVLAQAFMACHNSIEGLAWRSASLP
uniref:Uncharacterized protein n=1 Tax=Fusarium oxysporum (strain Fo5176) TaxID=660025 RepID=A0A0C4DIL9_FUSOF